MNNFIRFGFLLAPPPWFLAPEIHAKYGHICLSHIYTQGHVIRLIHIDLCNYLRIYRVFIHSISIKEYIHIWKECVSKWKLIYLAIYTQGNVIYIYRFMCIEMKIYGYICLAYLFYVLRWISPCSVDVSVSIQQT